MPSFALLEIPRDAAFKLAMATHRATGLDVGYQVKTTLSEVGDPLRPWRLLDSEPDVIRLIGVQHCSISPRSNGSEVSVLHRQEWEPVAGETTEFDLHVTPILQRKVRCGGPGDKRTTEAFDAACGSADRVAPYRDWVIRTIRPDSTGLEICGDPRIAHVRDHRVPRKFCGDSPGARHVVKTILIPSCRARFKAVVTDASLAADAVSRGIWKHKAFGFGTLLPKSVLDAAVAFGGFDDEE